MPPSALAGDPTRDAEDAQLDRRIVPPEGGPTAVVLPLGRAFDEAELRRGLEVLGVADSIHEVRALPSGFARHVRRDDPDGAIAVVTGLAPGSTGVYLTLNPLSVPPPDGRAARDRDIARRLRLLVDLDPVRPAGRGATEAQRAAAWGRAAAVRAELAGRGWADPTVVDSGNGVQLHYPIDLPNDVTAKGLVRDVLRALATGHDTAEVVIDRAVSNASRIVRLPGTVNGKGDGLGDRPHRLCRVVSAPDRLGVVSRPQLEALAAEASTRGRGRPSRRARAARPASRAGRRPGRAGGRDRGYALAALAGEHRRLEEAEPGRRHNVLFRAAASLGELIAGGLLDEQEVRLGLCLAAQRCGLLEEEGLEEVERTIGDGLARGAETSRGGAPPGPGRGPGGGDDSRPVFSNVRDVPPGTGGDARREPIDQPELVAELLRLTGGWPKQVAGRLFARDGEGGEILSLGEPNALFAWIGRRAAVRWARWPSAVPQARFFEALRQGVDRFDSIEHAPHFPPAPGVYYTSPPPMAGGDGSALEGLIDRFHPLTELDRELIRAFILTLFWGGDGGLRPLFLVEGPPEDPEGGRGLGKSSLVMQLSGLVGGYFGGISPAMSLETITRRIINDRSQKRVLLLDNVKSSRLSWADFEGLVTSRTVGGWRLHAGDEDRPNRITYAVTINEARLSSDLATRAVQLRLGRPASYDADGREPWSAAVGRQLVERRDRIVEDVAAAFDRPPEGLAAGRFRWAAWSREVLGRCRRGGEVLDLILARQAELNDDRAESEEFERFLADAFAGRFGRPAGAMSAWIPTSELARLASEFSGEKIAPRTLSRWLGLHRTPRLAKRDRNDARGWLWRGAEANEDEMVRDWNAHFRR